MSTKIEEALVKLQEALLEAGCDDTEFEIIVTRSTLDEMFQNHSRLGYMTHTLWGPGGKISIKPVPDRHMSVMSKEDRLRFIKETFEMTDDQILEIVNK